MWDNMGHFMRSKSVFSLLDKYLASYMPVHVMYDDVRLFLNYRSCNF